MENLHGSAERDISRKVRWTSRADYSASSVAGSNSDGFVFLRGQLLEDGYAVPNRPKHVAYGGFYIYWRNIEDLVARLQASVTNFDANVSRRVRENAVRRAVVCCEMDEVASNTNDY
jgi:hypothetical protein